MPDSPLPPAPYPGLRAFRPEETRIFCGRAEHRAEVLDLLGGARFLAVVGASGSGKSSLVLAGLLPDIRDGQLIGVDADTVRILSLQPGLRPFANLADALAAELASDLPVETMLRRGPLGLVQMLDEVENETDRALILVVDQFEEIFRFAEMSEAQLMSEGQRSAERPLIDGTRNEAQAFVNLLLQSASQTRHPVYVLLTMRSEFLARCDQFPGLPEAISRSQFLTPRLDRQQLEQAIVRPLSHYGASIQPELVNVVLNQISPEQDQLPLMQHALARMWERRIAACDAEGLTLTLDDYKAVGGLSDALNNHGDALCEELAHGSQHIALGEIERFFRTLAHHSAPNVPPVRRPIRVAQISAETGLSGTEVRAIADAFRAEGCHLLMPPVTKVRVLADDTFLDISHESLLRQWQRLKGWLATEWQQRRMAEELERSMEDWERTAPPEKKGDPVRRFLRWKEAGEAVATRLYRDAAPALFSKTAPPTLPVWARRYGIDWSRLDGFCQQAFWWKKVTGVLSKAGVGLVVLSVLLIAAVVFAVLQSNIAFEQREAAVAATQDARRAQANAEAERLKAVESSTLADKRKLEAERALEEEKRAKAIVETSAKDAVKQLAAAQLEFSGQIEAFQQLVQTALAEKGAGSQKLKKLLDAPEYRGLVQVQQAPTALPPIGAVPDLPKAADAALAVPTVLSLKLPPKPAPAPLISFLKTDDGLYACTGAEGTPLTFCWTPSGEAARPEPWAIETTRFVAAAGGDGIVVLSGDENLCFISGTGPAVSTKLSGETIAFGRLIRPGNARFVVFGTRSGRIGLWDLVSGSVPRLFNTGVAGLINGVDYSPARNALLASSDGEWAKMWRLPPSAKEGSMPVVDLSSSAETFEALGAPVRDATFSPDGSLMLLPIGAAEVEVRSTDRGAPLVASLRHQGRAWFAKFSPDGSMIASSDTSGRVYLWKTPSPPRKAARVELPGSQWIQVEDRASANSPEATILSGHRSGLTAMEWAPGGEFLVTSGKDGLAIIWQHPRARLAGYFNDVPFLLPSHPGGATGVAISPDGRLVGTAGADRVARIYPLRPVVRGKFREAPKAADIKGGGDLALLTEADAASSAYSDYFLPEQPAGTKGAVYRLKPQSRYISARWDYSFTPRTLLRATKVRVRVLDESGQPTGDFVEAQPVDWGPPPNSGFDLDLSPGLVQALGLKPGQSVEMEIPLIPPAPASARAAKAE